LRQVRGILSLDWALGLILIVVRALLIMSLFFTLWKEMEHVLIIFRGDLSVDDWVLSFKDIFFAGQDNLSFL
jgi:hypothetical protein